MQDTHHQFFVSVVAYYYEDNITNVYYTGWLLQRSESDFFTPELANLVKDGVREDLRNIYPDMEIGRFLINISAIYKNY